MIISMIMMIIDMMMVIVEMIKMMIMIMKFHVPMMTMITIYYDIPSCLQRHTYIYFLLLCELRYYSKCGHLELFLILR